MIFHDKSLWYKFMWQLRQYFVVSIDCDSYTTVGCVRYAVSTVTRVQLWAVCVTHPKTRVYFVLLLGWHLEVVCALNVTRATCGMLNELVEDLMCF